ncbi:MAG: Cysteine desulfurase [Pseudomonadota bacterium]|jgi:cysteine desulfurase
MSSDELYLDWNATSPLAPEVIAAMTEAQTQLWGNPASVHGSGRRARGALEEAREALGSAFDFASRDVLFCGSGTEANNLALSGCEALVTSRLEHPSVVRVADRLAREGRPVVWLPVAPEGLVSASDVEAALTQLPGGLNVTVAVMAANHETGVLQPIRGISQVASRYGARLHVDAVQLLGKGSLDELELVTSLSVSAHKIRGPKGIAALLFRGPPPTPVLVGGAQERGLRPGTQDAVAAVGFRVALARALERQTSGAARLAELRDQLEVACSGFADVNGCGARLPHVTNLSFYDFPGPELVAALDLHHIRVSSGSACSAGTSEPSEVIAAMHGRLRAERAVRFSLGESTDAASILRLTEVLAQLLPPRREH